MLQALNIPGAKAAVEKNRNKWKKTGKAADKSQNWETGDRWNKDEGRKSSFCLTDEHLSFEECWIGGKAPKIQGSSCTPRWPCGRWFRITRSIYWTGTISITDDSSKNDGYYIKTAGMRRTSSGCSICLHPECPDIWKRLPKHKRPTSWSSMEDPGVHLERNLHGHLLAGLLRERQFEKVLLKYSWEKVQNWECFFVNRAKGLFLSAYVDDIKLAGKKHYFSPMWKILLKEVDWPCLFGLHSKRL